MELILSCYNVLDRLQLDGEITIVEIKNRIRDGATATGYVDMNFRIVFRGHMCEFQILDKVMFDLKNESHSGYELCRSYNLVGPLPPVSTRRPSAVVRSVPFMLQLSLSFLRFAVGLFGAMLASGYYLFLFFPGYAILLVDQPLILKLVFGFAVAAPFSITSFMACSDLLSGTSRGHSRAMPCGVVVIGCGLLVSMGAASGYLPLLMVFCGVAAVYLLHVAAAAMVVRCGGCCDGLCGGRRRSGPSRTAMLYRRYFGINGTLFVWKAAALQLMTIVL
jgi:hypothetical protein